MSWEKVNLGNILKHRKSFITISDDKEYKLCRVQLHRRGVILREITKGSKIRTKKQQVCKPDDFIIAEMDAKVGGYGIIPENLSGAIVSSHYYLFELENNKIHKSFLQIILLTEILQDQIKAKGSTNYASVRPKDVLAWEITLPPIDEQISISRKIHNIKDRISILNIELTFQLDLVKQLRQAFLREAMQGKLVPQNPNDEPASILLQKIKAEKEKLGKEKKNKKEKTLQPIKEEEIPFEIPESWVWCRLGEIVERIHYGFNASAKSEKKDVRLLRITDIQDNKVNWESVPGCDYSDSDIENYQLKENDIVIARTGGTIGKSFIVRNISVKSLFASYLIRLIPIKLIQANHLKFFLESPIYWKQLYEVAWGAGQLNINGTSLSNIVIPLPPLPEQHHIVSKLNQLMSLCDELEQSIQQGKTTADKLLQQALKEALRK
ncbi:MAG: restriction endonuclease subunit S [Desulfobacterales bacterium]|nr:restriction endonuclease subunit S [Desulfobacterales bacterium]